LLHLKDNLLNSTYTVILLLLFELKQATQVLCIHRQILTDFQNSFAVGLSSMCRS